MKSVKQIILGYILVGIFAITFIPFNAFHQHEIDNHISAVLSQNSDHHCELDTNFCQQDLAQHCGHDSHISKTLTKCFSCQFHFIKTFDIANNHTYLGTLSTSFTHNKKGANWISIQSIRQLNKGPPACA